MSGVSLTVRTSAKNVSMDRKSLVARLLEARQTEPVRMAIEFLGRADLVPMDLRGENTAGGLLRVYRNRLALKPTTDLQEVGLAEVVGSLSNLEASTPLAMVGFQNSERIALFCMSTDGDIVGNILVSRRPPEEERERREWFDASA